jgi:hypothetical protein
MRRTPMRRTGFRRKGFTGNNPVAQERVEKPPMRLARTPSQSAPIFNPQPKHDYVRDEAYRRYVASHACFRCGIAGISQAAHANSAAAGKGMGIKASDEALFPLCATTAGRPGCHEEHDQSRDDLSRDERRSIELEWIARMESIAALEGYQTPMRRKQ